MTTEPGGDPQSALKLHQSIHFFERRLVFLAASLRDAAALGLSTKKSSRLAPALMASVIHRGSAPLPAQVFPCLSRYLTATLRPARDLLPERTVRPLPG